MYGSMSSGRLERTGGYYVCSSGRHSTKLALLSRLSHTTDHVTGSESLQPSQLNFFSQGECILIHSKPPGFLCLLQQHGATSTHSSEPPSLAISRFVSSKCRGETKESRDQTTSLWESRAALAERPRRTTIEATLGMPTAAVSRMAIAT